MRVEQVIGNGFDNIGYVGRDREICFMPILLMLYLAINRTHDSFIHAMYGSPTPLEIISPDGFDCDTNMRFPLWK